MYQLFSFLCREVRLSFEEYWAYKSRRVSHDSMLRELVGADANYLRSFTSRWMDLIEADEYLAIDKPFPDVTEFLVQLRTSASLTLCSARQFEDRTFQQLKRLGLLPLFEHVLVTRQVDTKTALIARHLSALTRTDWIIGDTGKDIQTGKELGISTCAVLSGFLSQQILADYSPSLICDYATDFRL